MNKRLEGCGRYSKKVSAGSSPALQARNPGAYMTKLYKERLAEADAVFQEHYKYKCIRRSQRRAYKRSEVDQKLTDEREKVKTALQEKAGEDMLKKQNQPE